MMRIQSETLRSEVSQILAILKQIDERIQSIPGEDVPAVNDMAMQMFEFQLVGELKLVAERVTALCEVLE